MFRTKYTLTEVARMLGRSRAFMERELKSGRLRAQSVSRRRRGGGNRSYLIALRELKRYMGTALSSELLGTPTTTTRQIEAPLERTAVFGSVKRCNICGRIRSVREYMKDTTYPDGHYPTCRDCMAEQAKRWRGSKR